MLHFFEKRLSGWPKLVFDVKKRPLTCPNPPPDFEEPFSGCPKPLPESEEAFLDYSKLISESEETFQNDFL